MKMAQHYSVQIQPLLLLILTTLLSSWSALAFTSTNTNHYGSFSSLARQRRGVTPLHAVLRKDVEIPLLDLIDRTISKDKDENIENAFIVPLPSSNFPDQLATPFLYGMQMDVPLHKLILEEAISMAETATISSSAPLSSLPKPFYGHLVWKDENSHSLVGAIGCTAEILVNAPTTKVLGAKPKTPLEEELAKLEKSFSDSKGGEGEESSSPVTDDSTSTQTSNTVLCRGGWRFIVTEVVRSIPYPVVIVDEIEDDADEDDSDMFSTVASEEDEDDDDDDDKDELANLTAPELIGNTLRNVQIIIKQQLEDAIAKTQLSPLEQSILESEMKAGGMTINPAVIELAHAEEMSAVWDVFQMSLVDDIEPSQRRFAVAIMAAELSDLTNKLRQEILLVRNAEERLRIVLRELKEIVGMAQARKLAASIIEKSDEDEKDLKVGNATLPPWAKQIKKGTKIEYFWNEEYEWCPGVVTEDPITIADELLLTIRFDGEEETHRLPVSAEDKLRWRPGK